MPSKSKIKGSTFERDVAKMFNTHFNSNEFSRTMGSGAFVGNKNWNKRAGLTQELKNALASDIIAPNWFPFSIECKHYDDTPIYHNLLDQGDPTLTGWLEKAIRDAQNTQTIPMLIFKTTRKGVFVAYPSIFDKLVTNIPKNRLIYGNFTITSWTNYKNIIDDVKRISFDEKNEFYAVYSPILTVF